MGFFDWFKSDPKKDIKKAADSFKMMQDRNIDISKGLGSYAGSFGSLSNPNTGFFDAYGEVIDKYLDQYGKTEEADPNIKLLKEAYLRLHPEKTPRVETEIEMQEMGSGSGRTQNAAPSTAAPKQEETTGASTQQTAERTNQTGQVSKAPKKKGSIDEKLNSFLAKTDLFKALGDNNAPELSKGIDPAAMKGLQDISRWMLRNCAKTGIFRKAKSADTQISDVNNFLLKQPARIKLYAYYMIENRKRKETDPEKINENIVESQTGYAPNLEAFKSKMIAKKFKFWMRFMGNEIYWNKLDEAFHTSIACKEYLTPFGAMGVKEASGGAEDASKEDKEQQEEDNKASKENASDSDRPAGEKSKEGESEADDPVTKESKTRDKLLKEFQDCQSKILKEYQLMKTLKKEEQPLKELAFRVLRKTLIEKLLELNASDKKIDAEYEKLTRMDVSNQAQENMTTQISGYAALGGTAGNAAGQAVIQAGSHANIVTWGLEADTDGGIKKLKEAGSITSIVGASFSLASLVMNAVNAYRHGATMTAGAKMMAATNILANTMGIAEGVTRSAQLIAGAGKTAMNITGSILGAATGGANLIAGIVESSNASDQVQSMSSSMEAFKERKTAEGSDFTENDKRKATNISRLGILQGGVKKDQAQMRMISSGLQMIGGALSFTGFGAIASVLGAGVSLYSYYKKLAAKSQIINETIDDYVDMPSIYESIVDSNEKLQEEPKQKLLRQLRIEVASRMGYSSKENLFNSITVEYARDIHKHVFFKGRQPATAENHDKDYVKLLNGLHLEPDFANKKPKVNTIAYALQHL